MIRSALAHNWPPERRTPSRLLHGDFWPGNTLWRMGRLTAVIDWEDAARGDPLADPGNGRLEVALLWGREAMQAFTDHYLTKMPGLAAPASQRMKARHAACVDEVLKGRR